MEIVVTSKQLKPDDLISRLENTPEWKPRDVKLILRKKDQAFRTLDPTVVVAIVSGVSAGLGALVTGALDIAKQAKSRVIVVQDKEGRRLEIPSDCPKEKIGELLEIIRKMEAAKIEIP